MRLAVPARLAGIAAVAVFTLQLPAASQAAVAAVPAVRVNAGGGAYLTKGLTKGKVSWAGDRGFVGGWTWKTSSGIAGTTEPGLFQTQRLGARGYELPVAGPGRFRVKLLLAEGQFSGRGKRVFDVAAEGRAALRNVDAFAVMGRYRAHLPSFDTQVTDGRLSLAFTARKSVPAVAGIEAVYLGPVPTTTTAPPTTTVPPTTTTLPPTTTTAPPNTTGPAAGTGQQLFVSPSGSDKQPGTAASAPLRTIQAALAKAKAGTTINLAPGTYAERPVTVTGGTAGAPITIKGPETGIERSGRYKAVLTGTSRVLSINHSHIHLRGFTIDGQPGLSAAAYPAGPVQAAQAEAFKQASKSRIADGRLVYVGAADSSRDITGVVIDDMFLSGAGGECVRLRNNAHDNTVTNSVIQWCGLYAKEASSTKYAWHNGEAVYIGTSPKSTDQPMHANDSSSWNLVSGNVIRTYGSECFNVKENAHDNEFSGNDCAGNTEATSFLGSNVELRGYDNVVRGNRIHDSSGFGLKLAADSAGYRQGGNSIVGNTFTGNAGADISNKQTGAQGTVCGNLAGVVGGLLSIVGTAIGLLDAGC